MASNESQARALARKFRHDHNLGAQPIKDLFELGHIALGIDVMSMEADEAEHGLTMSDPATDRIVIAVATTQNPMRQRSTIAHEFCHVIAGDLELEEPPIPGARSDAEIRADAFARHLLLPRRVVRERFPLGQMPQLDDLSDLVQEFEVSPQIAAIQLREESRITHELCKQWSSLSAGRVAAAHGWGSQYRSLVIDSSSPRSPQDLMARAVEGYRRGVLGLTELASWYAQDPGDLAETLGPTDDLDDFDDDFDDDAPLFPKATAGGASS